jgi:hypothetical protein
MCMGKKYSTEILNILDNLRKDHQRLRGLQSYYDGELHNVYLEIETKKFNAAQGYLQNRKLQKLLRERRIVKIELSQLQKIARIFDSGKVEETVVKVDESIDHSDTGNIEYTKNWNIHIRDVLKEVNQS